MGILTIDSVLKYYGNKTILNDISFEVKESDTLAVFGRNGSGKTTLLNIILGLEKCDYIFRRYDNNVIKRNAICKLFSYSSQKIFISDYMKIRQLIKLFNIKNREVVESDELISKSINLRFKDLSDGQQFYVQLVLVINSKKKICVLDEPFSGQSPLFIDNIVNYINLNKDKIFIIADHNIEKLYEISNRRFFLKHGSLINSDGKNLNDIKEMYYHTMI